ncbi:MAG: VWA domain-containing protein [Clostridia bacterium]|nr:VWA domain-containing protein [Clostridia bacterium]
MKLYCPYCGQLRNQGDTFCMNCGRELPPVSVPASPERSGAKREEDLSSVNFSESGTTPTPSYDSANNGIYSASAAADGNIAAVNPPVKKNRRNKGLIIVIAILATLLALTVVVGTLLFLRWNDENKKVSNTLETTVQTQEKTSEETQKETAETFESANVDELIRDAGRYDIDGSADNYISVLKEWKNAVDAGDEKAADELMKKAKSELEALISLNNDICDGKIDEYESVDLSRADEQDRKAMEGYIKEIEDLKKDGRYYYLETVEEYADALVLKYSVTAEEITISVQQVDVRSYPLTKLYLDISDGSGNVPSDLQMPFFYIDKKDADGNYIKQKVTEVTQLNESETLNVNVVADISGSMYGYPIAEAKNIMESFVGTVQFNAGDEVELITFSDDVYIDVEFTNDLNKLVRAIRGLDTYDMTSLYDALYTAVIRVASRPGAKCVMAFTDGMDNDSRYSVNDVIDIARRYNVPIFLIGVGTVDTTVLQRICTETGGEYHSAAAVTDIKELYNEIYRREKELYMVCFEDSSGTKATDSSYVNVIYDSYEYTGECAYSYEPKVLIEVDSSDFYLTGPEATVEKYIKGYADAQTKSDFSYIEPYLKKGSPIYEEQMSFVKSEFELRLDSFEIIDVKYNGSSECIVTTNETYYVQSPKKPLHLLTQECKYVLRDEGSWLLTAFAENVKVLREIKK